MPGPHAALQIETVPRDPVPTRARATGAWTFNGLKEEREKLVRRFAELLRMPAQRIAWDLTGITELDDAGAVWLARAIRDARHVEAAPHHEQMLAQVTRGLKITGEGRRFDPLRPLASIGEAASQLAIHLRDATLLLGRLVIDAAGLLRRPSEVPLREISAGVFRAGVTALPVTMLVGFLVGIVLTYLSALQLKRYGADLLVINIVGVGVLRELGPMLASIIAAGRSGSAMTAQLGVMRVTEEIDALSVMGVSVTLRLVFPKVLALAIALPLVTFCTDLAAIGGAILVSQVTLGITPAAFLEAMPRAVNVVNFWIGIWKSAAFGFTVAFVACHFGLRILPNTDSLAVGVTRSVVAAITCVIILDALFAVLLKDVG